MSARKELANTLKPLLPKAWRLVPYADNLDTLDRVVVMIKQTQIERLPAAPIGTYRTSFVVTVIAPQSDSEKAEDELDDGVHEVLSALDSINNSLWSSAEKVLFSDSNLAWDIAMQVVTRKDN